MYLSPGWYVLFKTSQAVSPIITLETWERLIPRFLPLTVIKVPPLVGPDPGVTCMKYDSKTVKGKW